MSEHEQEHDPIEDDPILGPLVEEARLEAEAQLNADGRLGQFGSCHGLWGLQKDILLKKYGIRWRSPADMNPGILFD